MDALAFLVESTGERTPIEGDVTIGRAPGVTLWLDDPAVSRRHAIIRRSGGDFVLEDLRSANGTYVNDDLIQQPVILRPGDHIRIGTSEFIFVVSNPLPEPAAAETQMDESLTDDLTVVDDHTVFAPIPDELPAPAPTSPVAPTVSEEAIPPAVPEPPMARTAPNLLQLAAQVARLAQETEDLAESLRRVARLLAESYGVDGACIYLPDPAGDELVGAVVAGRLGEGLLGSRVAIGRGAVGAAYAERQAQRRGVEGDEDGGSLVEGLRSILTAPILLRDGAVVSVLALINPTWKPAFDDDDRDFAVLLVQQLSTAAPARGNWDLVAKELAAELRAQRLRLGFVTVQPDLRALVNRAMDRIVAGSPVFLWGEPGSGRRKLARVANMLAGGDEAAFVGVDCRLLPSAQQREALFGPGGAWDRAATGLLCLAHATALEASAAASLGARLAEAGRPRVVFVGEEPADAPAEVLAAGGEDQFYLPPLRERKVDVGPLASHFAGLVSGRYGIEFGGFDQEAREQLEQSDWPGNVAGLERVVLRAVILSEAPEVSAGVLAWLAPEVVAADRADGAERSARDRVRNLCAELVRGERAPEAILAAVRRLTGSERTLALSVLLDAVESAASADERSRLLALLARVGDGRASRYVAGLLDDPDPRLRQAAILGVAEMAAPEQTVARVRALAGGEGETAALALLALARLHDPEAPDLFDRALLESGDERVRVAASAALSQFDATQPQIQTLWAELVRRAQILPARILTGAFDAGAIDEGDLQRLLADRTLSAAAKSRIVRLVGQSAGARATDLLVDLAARAADGAVQSTVAEQLLQQGAAIAALPRLLVAAEPAARGVAALLVQQLPSAELPAALSRIEDDPGALRAFGNLIASDPALMRSLLADAIDADWRLDPLLRLLRLAPASRGQ